MIKQIGDTVIQATHLASCHCGAVMLELSLPNGIEKPRRCDCSICRRKGAIVCSVPLAGLKIIKGEAVLKCYEFNTKTAKHTSALCAAFIPIIKGALIPMNMAITLVASKALILMN